MPGKTNLFVSLLILVGLVVSSLAAAPTLAAAQAERPPRPLERIPDEIYNQLQGITLDEFLVNYRGPLPNALRQFADRTVEVIVQFEQAPLARHLLERGAGTMSAAEQRSYQETLAARQQAVIDRVQAAGGTLIGRLTKVYNGVQVRVPASELAALRAMPGVKAVHRAPIHTASLEHSITLINADDVWNLPEGGFTGAGVTVAVIDTGIDYTHASFGGAGTREAYENNDPSVLEDEDGFPSAKVIGGWDFAGTDYDASSPDPALNTPDPDPDPLDEDGHGTHVASTVAGIAVPDSLLGQGVAPDALLYALKVFGAEGSTTLTLLALEWAMDPDGDGDISDHVDVINMSLGADFGPADPLDPEIEAVNNLSEIGVVVVVASGNAGDSSYITSSPAAADAAISVGATTSSQLTGSYVETPAGDQVIYADPSIPGAEMTEDVTGPLFHVINIPGMETDTLCAADVPPDLSGDELAGSIALIQRGVCSFEEKISVASELGASAAIIYNHADGGDELITMVGDQADIPAVFVGRTGGLALAAAHGQTVTIYADRVITVSAGVDNAMAGFSGRGPRGYDSFLKPEISAPGTNIFAADVGTGSLGTGMQGTSMATPHVAGVAALMKEAHPDWTAQQIKAAMINTAVDLDHPMPLMGAGLVDALAAVQADTLAIGDEDLVSLSWGVIEIPGPTYTATKTVNVYNLTGFSKTYTASVGFSGPSETAGASLSVPASVTVPAYGVATLPVNLTLNASAVKTVDPLDPNAEGWPFIEEYYGFVTLTNTADPDDVLRVPFYIIPRPYTDLQVIAGPTVDPSGTSGGVVVRQTGPIPSSLWLLPAYVNDVNEVFIRDNADIRLIGVDYLGADPEFGDLLVFGFSSWAPVHVLQPYFAETDLYLDVDQDGADDYVIFNANTGFFAGTDDTNVWVLLYVDLNAPVLTLDFASPFTILADYNSGYMEWYLPALLFGLGNADGDPSTPPVTTFDFQAFGFDFDSFDDGEEDATARVSIDYANPPFIWLPSNLTPHNEFTELGFLLNPEGYEANQPIGVILVDYMGKPGTGQARLLEVTFGQWTPVFPPSEIEIFLPFVGSD